MGTKGKYRPRESDGGGYWRWLNVDYGCKADGWVAGDLHIVPVHPGRPSLACEDELSGEKGVCPHCKPNTDVKDLGYLPVYRDDNIPCVLTLHPHQFEMVSGLSWGVAITWGRRSGDLAESTYVTPRTAAPGYTTTLASRREPADITIAIARYWKRPDLLPLLLRHFGHTSAGAARPTPAGPVTVTAPTKQPARPRASSSRESRMVEALGGPMPELLTEVQQRLLKAVKAREAAVSQNGRHG